MNIIFIVCIMTCSSHRASFFISKYAVSSTKNIGRATFNILLPICCVTLSIIQNI